MHSFFRGEVLSSSKTALPTRFTEQQLNKQLLDKHLQASKKRRRDGVRHSLTVANYHGLYKVLERADNKQLRNAGKVVETSSKLSVLRLSTGCLVKPPRIMSTISDYYLGKLDWV